MANKEQLAILKKGVKTWNNWREKNPKAKIDLSNSNLRGVNFSHINLSAANLSQANFSRSEFRSADLRKANLNCAKLPNADLSGLQQNETLLQGVDLRNADLGGVNFTWTVLSHANLKGANLEGATLYCADLSRTNLGRTNLARANFTSAIFLETEFEIALLNGTTFDDVALDHARNLDTVNHIGPSTIGIDTIYRSKGKISEDFLQKCGVPLEMIAFTRSLEKQPLAYYSCFISHSAKDKRFCERLYADLQSKGVRVWYFPEDAKWGETVWGEIDHSIKVYDKLIVVCSENSLQSGPVNREIERALVREDKESKGVLFPIRIDNYIFDKWEHERKVDVLRKVVGDFSDWDKDAAKYNKAFDKLLKGLQAGNIVTKRPKDNQ